MLVKCICTNCAGHLEFEKENAGEKIKCPLCGFETVLFLPGAERPEAQLASLTRKLQVQQRFVFCLGCLIGSGAIAWVLYGWVVPTVAAWLPDNDSRIAPVLLTAALCVTIPLLLAWLVLPFLLFCQARRCVALLEQIEENLRPQQQELPPFTRSDLVSTENAKKM